MDVETFRRAGHAAIDEIADYFDTLAHRPVQNHVEPGFLIDQLPPTAPSSGQSWTDILHDLHTKIMPGIVHWQHPDFLGFFPTAVSLPSILGELYSAAFSSPGFTWQAAPSQTELEIIVMDWMAQILHLPSSFLHRNGGGGVIQGTASESIILVMVAARERAVEHHCRGLEGFARQQAEIDIRPKLVALGSDQSHSSTAKAAVVAGVHFRTVPTLLEQNLSMQASALQEVVEQCQQDGLLPFYVTVTIGTTSTCAVDDVEAITRHSALWIHVDAAWAGSALILEEYAHLARVQADSFGMNMHKWLLTNFDAAALFVQDRRQLTDVLTLTPAYLRNAYNDHARVTDYKDWSMALGRRFRALKVWFVLRTYGVEGLQSHVRRHIELGNEFAGWVRSQGHLFALLTRPAFALTVFYIQSKKVQGSADSDAQLNVENELTSRTQTLMTEKGVVLTKTSVGRRIALRVVSATERTSRESLERVFRLLVETVTCLCDI